MNPQQRLALLGAVTLLLLQRKQFDALEVGTAQLLEDFGAKVPNPLNDFDTVLSVVRDWVIEDRSAEEIVDKIVARLEFSDA
jgi:hypothetical protein